ncbi:sensor histidine kinase [Propioniciclava coleopterorum]|uniref:histidine kinase n=1 Tax=Propioniciclava coleopterorum TaxID=2714937 RepID=A0A6G7Y885_9ACTN|nr:sensor histidine kinase [Propioniciclava coleopterorum]QIK72827.1 sensor histidine kinase [Propioniciclava coleopterorum]
MSISTTSPNAPARPQLRPSEPAFWFPRPTDLAFFLVVTFFCFADSYLGSTVIGLYWLGMAVPMLWRLKFPDLVALVIIPAHLIQLVFNFGPTPANVVVPIMLYTVAAYGRERWRSAWLFVGIGAALLAAIGWNAFNSGGSREAAMSIVTSFAGMASLVAASWAIGTAVRSRTLASESQRHAFAVEQTQHQQAVILAATQERQRLAREMHDVVAHSLAVIVVQADGGAYAAGMETLPPEQRLATAEKALQTIRTTAQESLVETRRLVGVLREGQDVELAPAASLSDMQGLVDGLTAAGRDVRLEVSGDVGLRRLLSPAMELAIFRIVQEGLTNAVKHAGDDASVRVRIHHAPAGVSVQVRDNGRGAGMSDGLGHGLVGMRERVAAFGGSMNARNHITGGFVIEAFLPTTTGAAA